MWGQMPHDDADSGGDESDSDHDGADADADDGSEDEPELLTAEKMQAAMQAKRQKALDAATIEDCVAIRTVGDRYETGIAIPRIAEQEGLSLAATRRRVQQYYLVHANPPVDELASTRFETGVAFFRDGVDLAELDVDTRERAETYVRQFAGRVLVDNERSAVDINQPLPPMDRTAIEAVQETPDVVAELASPPAGILDDLINPFPAATAAGPIKQAINGGSASLSSGVLRDIQQAMRVDGLYGKMLPAVGASAAVSSFAVTSGALAGDPVAFDIQPAVRGLVDALAAMPDLNQSWMPGSSQVPFGRLSDQLFNEELFQQISQIVSRLEMEPMDMTGVAASGAATTVVSKPVSSEPTPTTRPVEPPEPTSSPQEAYAPTAPIVDSTLQPTVELPALRERAGAVDRRVVLGLAARMAPLVVEAVFFELQRLYPEQKVSLFYAQLVAFGILESVIWYAMFREN
jgi:hypothetical protein